MVMSRCCVREYINLKQNDYSGLMRGMRGTPRPSIVTIALLCFLAFVCVARVTHAAHDDGLSSGIVDDFTCDVCDTTQFCSGGSQVQACPGFSTSSPQSSHIHECICDDGYQKTCGSSVENACNSANVFTCEIGAAPYYYAGGAQQSCLQNRETVQAVPAVNSNVDNVHDCLCIVGYEPDPNIASPDPALDDCTECANGHYKDAANNDPCTSCPEDSHHLSTGETDISSCQCNAGHQPTDGDPHICEDCPAGTFKSSPSDDACDPCTANHYCVGETVTPDACRGNSQVERGGGETAQDCLCNAGYTLASAGDYESDCVECAAGKFKGDAGNEACTVCDAGTYADRAGFSACLACGDNSNSYDSDNFEFCKCNVGFAGDHSSADVTCTACEAGKYADTTGSESCKPCPANSHVEATGSDELEDCTCNAGYVMQDVDGNRGTDPNTCEACPVGQFELNDVCVQCEAGKYSLGAAEDDTDCLPCIAHSAPNAEQSQCECLAGHTCRLPYISLDMHNKINQYGTVDGIIKLDLSQTSQSKNAVWGKGTVYGFYMEDFIKEAYDVDAFSEFPECTYDAVAEEVAANGACRLPAYNAAKDNECVFGEDTGGTPCEKDLCMNFGSDNPSSGPLFGSGTNCVNSLIVLFFKKENVANGARVLEYMRYFYEAEQDIDDVGDASFVESIKNDETNDWVMWKMTQANHWGKPTASNNWGINVAYFKNTEFYSRETVDCINGDCAPCAFHTFKDTIGPALCTDCQDNSQTEAEGSDNQDLCKCNMGYYVNDVTDDSDPPVITEHVCAPCEGGHYSDALDSDACTACPEAYTATMSNPPWTSSTACEACNLCAAGQYWASGCVNSVTPQKDIDDAVCADCPALSTTDLAAAGNTPNAFNQGVDSCTCVPGAYYDEDPYVWPRQTDDSVSLFRSCHTTCNSPPPCPCRVVQPYDSGINRWNPSDKVINNNFNEQGIVTIGFEGPSIHRLLAIELDDVMPINEVSITVWLTFVKEGMCGCEVWFSEDTAEKHLAMDDEGSAHYDASTTEYQATNVNNVPLKLSGTNYCDESDLNNIFKEITVSNGGFATFTWELQAGQRARSVLLKGSRQSGQAHMDLTELSAYGPLKRSNYPACAFCRQGTYKNARGNEACTTCPSGSTTLPTADGNDDNTNLGFTDQLSDCLCAEGQYLDDGDPPACQACGFGEIKTAISNDVPCELCSADETHTWTENGAQAAGMSYCSCNAGYTGPANGPCTACEAGKFKADGGLGGCTSCEAGKYQNQAGQTECLTCQSDSTSPERAVTCACNAGFQNAVADEQEVKSYDVTGVLCMACPSGSFKSSSGFDECESCTPNCGIIDGIPQKPIDQNAFCTTTSDLQCKPCASCGIGFVATECPHSVADTILQKYQDTVCNQCEEGFFCPKVINYFRDDMEPCPDGRTSPAGSVERGQCGCEPGNYHNGDRCVACTGDTWCFADVRFSCPTNSRIVLTDPAVVTQSDHDHVADCDCNAGYYRLANEANFPEADFPSGVDDSTDLVAGENAAYYFECRSCILDSDGSLVDNTYCNNNQQFECPANEHTGSEVSETDQATDCKCVAGRYRNSDTEACDLCPTTSYCPAVSDTRVPCPTNRETLAEGMAELSDCKCTPGFYNPRVQLGIDPAESECVPCPANSYCDGASMKHTKCTDDSTSPIQSVDAGACKCNAGFGCVPDADATVELPANCPKAGGHGTCTACAASTTFLTGGAFKPDPPSNTQCTACSDCTEGLEYASQACTATGQRVCSDCGSCASGSYIDEACTVQSPNVCRACLTCGANQYEFSDCKHDIDRDCRDINTDVATCSVGDYLKAPADDGGKVTSDSECQACTLPNSASHRYFGLDLHTFTSHGTVYNNPNSCEFECKNNPPVQSVLRDKSDLLQGCQSCETLVLNFLTKDITIRETSVIHPISRNTLNMPVECVASCKDGFELKNGDCVVANAPNSFLGYLEIANSQRTMHSGHEGFLFYLQFPHDPASYHRFVVGIGKDKPSCTPRSPKPSAASCCFGDLYRLTALSDMGVVAGHPLDTFCAQAHTSVDYLDYLDFEKSANSDPHEVFVPDSALQHVADCAPNDAADQTSRLCKFWFAYIDVVLNQQVALPVHIQLSKANRGVFIGSTQHYIALDNFVFRSELVRLGTSPSDTALYSCIVHLKTSASASSALLLSANIRVVGLASDGSEVPLTFKQLLPDDTDDTCSRYRAQLQASSATHATAQTIQLSGAMQAWQTHWKIESGQATYEDLHSLHAHIRIYNEVDGLPVYVSQLQLVRQTTDHTPICVNSDAALASEVAFTSGLATVGFGFEPTMMPAQSLSVAGDSPAGAVSAPQYHGALNQLCTVMLAAQPHVQASITNVRVFALHMKVTDADLQNFKTTVLPGAVITQTYTVLNSQLHSSITDFSPEVRAFCSTRQCLREVITDNSPLSHFMPECGQAAQKTAGNAWLARNFGNVPETHLQKLCVSLYGNHPFTNTKLLIMVKLRASKPGWDSVHSAHNADLTLQTFVWISAHFNT